MTIRLKCVWDWVRCYTKAVVGMLLLLVVIISFIPELYLRQLLLSYVFSNQYSAYATFLSVILGTGVTLLTDGLLHKLPPKLRFEINCHYFGWVVCEVTNVSRSTARNVKAYIRDIKYIGSNTVEIVNKDKVIGRELPWLDPDIDVSVKPDVHPAIVYAGRIKEFYSYQKHTFVLIHNIIRSSTKVTLSIPKPWLKVSSDSFGISSSYETLEIRGLQIKDNDVNYRLEFHIEVCGVNSNGEPYCAPGKVLLTFTKDSGPKVEIIMK